MPSKLLSQVENANRINWTHENDRVEVKMNNVCGKRVLAFL